MDMFIEGAWVASHSGETDPVTDPSLTQFRVPMRRMRRMRSKLRNRLSNTGASAQWPTASLF